MLLEIDNVGTRFVVGTSDEEDWLKIVLSWTDTSKMFVKTPDGKVERKKDDDGVVIPAPEVSTYNNRTKRFPTGLLFKVREAQAVAGNQVEYRDIRVRPAEPRPELVKEWADSIGLVLRDLQVDGIAQFLRFGRGILQVATGGGKTKEAMGIVAAIPGVKWICIVISTDLLTNMVDTFHEAFPGEKCGVIHGKKCELDNYFVVATYQTLFNRLKSDPKMQDAVDSFTGLIYDEVHTAAGKRAYMCVMAFRKAYYRLGLSATPDDRADGKTLLVKAGFGRIIQDVRAKTLVDEGILARPTIHLVNVIQTDEESVDWLDDYNKFIINSRLRYTAYAWVLARMVERGETPALVLGWSLEHIAKLHRVATALGYSTQLVVGKSNQYIRKTAKRLLDDGDIQFVIASDVFVTGIDAPGMRGLVKTGGKKAKISNIQGIGRSLRKTATKDTVAIYDFIDKVPRGELKNKPGNYYNHQHSTERKKIYAREGHLVVDVQTFE